MKRVAIVQARMTSTRLPGKVLTEVAGAPMLAHQLRRLHRCRSLDAIVLATTRNAADDPVVELAHREDVDWFRGDEQDVLGRYAGACRQAGADLVVRVTADCPLLDPEVVDRVVDDLVAHADSCDYASNILQRSYPQGLDVEAMFADVLMRVHRLAASAAAREHVTLFIYTERPELFICRNVEAENNDADLRWTVDTEPDLELVRTLYDRLHLAHYPLPYGDVVKYVRRHPDLQTLNAGIKTWEPPRQKPSVSDATPTPGSAPDI